MNKLTQFFKLKISISFGLGFFFLFLPVSYFIVLLMLPHPLCCSLQAAFRSLASAICQLQWRSTAYFCRAILLIDSSGFVGPFQRGAACSIKVQFNMHVAAFPHGESVSGLLVS